MPASWLTAVAALDAEVGIAVRSIQAETVKLAPGPVSRTGPVVVMALFVPLKSAAPPVNETAVADPLCPPVESSESRPIYRSRSLFRAVATTNRGSAA
jgi:hypothetical protein